MADVHHHKLRLIQRSRRRSLNQRSRTPIYRALLGIYHINRYPAVIGPLADGLLRCGPMAPALSLAGESCDLNAAVVCRYLPESESNERRGEINLRRRGRRGHSRHPARLILCRFQAVGRARREPDASACRVVCPVSGTSAQLSSPDCRNLPDSAGNVKKLARKVAETCRQCC